MVIAKIGSPEVTSDIRVLGGDDMFGMHWCKNACISVNFRECACVSALGFLGQVSQRWLGQSSAKSPLN